MFLAFSPAALGTFTHGVERRFVSCPRLRLDPRYEVRQCCAARTTVSVGTLHLGLGGENSQYQRAEVLRELAGFVVAIIWASTAAAAPAQPARGEKLARHWCASCHIVANDQKGGSDAAPPFATIARKPGFDGGKITQFLMDPHPKMPDMQLSRDEAKDLGAYIASLAK
jgi:mono/diheme cytochrome c family protein